MKKILVLLSCLLILFAVSCHLEGTQETEPAPGQTPGQTAPSTQAATTEGTTPSDPDTTDAATAPADQGTESSSPNTDPPSTAPSTDGESESAAPPRETDAPATTPPEADGLILTYEEYVAMNGDEQVIFFEQFDSIEDFFIWYNAAQADYIERHPGAQIGPDGTIILP